MYAVWIEPDDYMSLCCTWRAKPNMWTRVVGVDAVCIGRSILRADWDKSRLIYDEALGQDKT